MSHFCATSKGTRCRPGKNQDAAEACEKLACEGRRSSVFTRPRPRSWARSSSSFAPAACQAEPRPSQAVAKDARLAGDRERTRFIADLSKKVEVRAFALDDPYRVIVDVPDVSFQMPDGIGKEKSGLVTAYRYGLFAPGKSRIVIDVTGPFLIDKAFVLERNARSARTPRRRSRGRPTRKPSSRRSSRKRAPEAAASVAAARTARPDTVPPTASPSSSSTPATAASIPARQGGSRHHRERGRADLRQNPEGQA